VNALRRYVQFWDRREGAQALALVRIGVGLVMLCDGLQILRLDLVKALWAPIEEGGIGPSSYREPIGWVESLFGASAGLGELLFALSMLAAFTLCIGLCTRLSAATLLVCSAQLSVLAPDADRGIDTLLRNTLAVLMLSGAGATWSIDARRRGGHFASQVEVWAWPRMLLIAQLVLMYFWAGVYKQSAAWTSLGEYSALFRVLSKPHYSRWSWSHAQLVAFYPLLQAATFATLLFERGAFLVPFGLWVRAHPERGGRLGALIRRARLLEIWIATGVFFHVQLAAFTKLGIFPWGCLALYPALARPAVLQGWIERVSARPVRPDPPHGANMPSP
jgi:hypothetical protein